MISLSISSLVILVLVLAAIGFIHSSMQVREMANRVAKDACRRGSLQFLDGTVALAGMRPRLVGGGLRIERTYVFDYTVGGAGRASGFVIMLGQEMQHVGLQSDGSPSSEGG